MQRLGGRWEVDIAIVRSYPLDQSNDQVETLNVRIGGRCHLLSLELDVSEDLEVYPEALERLIKSSQT